ncbi:Hypothetical predicted protein [Mytilus galloprovincialis]|uniref:Uncharacterized protein n=1 Tax=Mytilus galloprovincialis TaxID=29158 RepID=A0A8B6D3F6_MYTGA|nr:Hypothetical predicted protein [Mytilus galloprovincialis]
MKYPGDFTTFDGIFVDCIVDKRFQNHTIGKGFVKYDDKLVALTAQYKSMLRLHSQAQDYKDNKIPYKDFHDEMINQIIVRDKKINFDDGMVCRFILSHSNKYDQDDLKDLHLALKNAARLQAHSFAKAIAWKFTKLFVKTLSKKQYYDIWPGNICNCKEDSNIPSSLRFCSNHIVIVVEVFHFEDVKPRPNFFCELPIAYRIVNGYSNEANLISKKIDQFDGKKEQLQTVKGLSTDIAEELFASHSKLCLISSSPIKSKKYGKSDRSKRCGKSNIEHIKQPCIQLFCREKRIIPAGEAHFPRSINSVPTDVLEGYPRMLVQHVTIGSEIGPQNGRTGTLGGFVKFHGKDAFLTCAHVLVDRKYLVSNANRADIHENPISVYCKHSGGDEFLCGKLVSYVFPPETFQGSSVDAAIVKLKSASMGHVTLDNKGNCLPQDYLHKSFMDHQEIDKDIQIVAVGAVSSIQQGTDHRHLESMLNVEFETLNQAVKNQFIQNPDIDITDRVHLRDVERILEDVGDGIRIIPRSVALFQQISMRKLAFSPGDSGTCIYAKGHDDKFRCIGMAIASHPDGGCIITPIKPILSAFKLI